LEAGVREPSVDGVGLRCTARNSASARDDELSGPQGSIRMTVFTNGISVEMRGPSRRRRARITIGFVIVGWHSWPSRERFSP
jgi:hypothetical protein